MNRYAKDNRDGPHPRPVERIEATGKSWKFRVAAVAVLLAIGLFFIGTGLYQALTMENGWREIEVNTKTSDTCASRFTLLYDLGYSGASASAEYKQVAAVYSAAAEKAFKLFHSYESFEGINNLHSLSAAPNQVLTVEAPLYGALQLLHDSGSRLVYLAPVYEQYFTLFNCRNDSEASNFDPFANADLSAYFREVCSFASDPKHIDLELLEDNRVMLFVSEEYLAYAKEQQIEVFLDLFWMEQAFQIDLIADALQQGGYTYAALTSQTGYSRVLDSREGSTYHTSLLAYTGSSALISGRTVQTGPLATVSLRDYRLSSDLTPMSYTFSDGSIRSAFADPADGLCRSACHDLVGYSTKLSCAQIALSLAPVYIADEPDEQALNGLREQGLFTVYTANRQIRCNDPDLTIQDLYESTALTFTKEFFG